MPLLPLLLLILHVNQALSNHSFPVLRDSVYDSQPPKTLLKNKLLDNLNNFFGGYQEQMEMLQNNDPKPQESGNDVEAELEPITSPPQFPTLIANTEPPYELPTPPSVYESRHGRIKSDDALDTIRDWRKKLYKAFKLRKPARKFEPTEKSNDDDFGQRRQSSYNWQNLLAAKQVRTFGKEPNGKLIPLSELDSSSDQAIRPYEPETPKLHVPTGQRVVYIPAPNYAPVQQPKDQLVAVPMPAMPRVPVHILAPPTQSQQPQQFIIPPTPAATLGQFNSLPTLLPQVLQAWTAPPPAPNMPLFTSTAAPQFRSRPEQPYEDRDLQNDYNDNIVATDAEASKKAVQSAAEAETGMFFDAICGTGFFSYIAHTDEFCLASHGGVNCYVFSPVCMNSNSNQMMYPYKKRYLNKN